MNRGKPADALTLCLQQLLRHYDLRPDIDSLRRVLPRPAQALGTDDLPLICERLKLVCESEQATEADAARCSYPVILVAPDGSAPRLYLPVETGSARLFHPETGMQPCPPGSLGNAAVRLISIRPREERTIATAEHMERRHPVDWFWEPMRTHWRSFAEVLVCSVFINLFILLMPLFTLNVYDQVVPNFATDTLVVLTVGILLAMVFDLLLKTARTYILERVASKVGSGFDVSLMERLLLINPEMMRLSTGERANLFKELQGIREFYASRLIPTAVDLPFFVVFMVVMYLISPPLVVVPIAGAVIIVAISAAVQIPINRATAAHFSSMQKKSSLLTEMLSGTSTFKLFNALGSRLFRWKLVAENSSSSTRLNQFLLGLVQNIALSMVQIVNVIVVVVGVYQIQAGTLSIGGLIACTILSGRAIVPIVNLGSVVSRWQQSRDVLIAVDRLYKLPHEGQRAVAQSAEGQLEGSVRLSSVTYTYPQQRRPALVGVDIAISPGEHVGLIGPSGAGKSTLAGLLTGLMHGYEGDIDIDGVHIDDMAPARLRQNVAFVPQTAFMVDGTIRDNVLLGSEDAEEAALDEALAISGLDIVLRQAGYSLDTPVGENGMRLSGGQRQAVSLARALVRNPDILVVDEPATGLDSTLEARLRVRLQAWLKGRTFIMVTHRSSMLDLVDRLIVLDGGRVAGDGPKKVILERLAGNNAQGQEQSRVTAGGQPIRH
ncbi:MAG: ATP-binding cassette domain-containing protein [Pseudomonadales bacterium]|nr:ATP-binding cassette domain-containing protein [Pseudomonadales bacterium]